MKTISYPHLLITFLFLSLQSSLIHHSAAQTGSMKWHAVPGEINGTVNALFADGNDLYVGGTFFNAGGIQGANFIARWDGTQWHAMGNGPSTGSVLAITKFRDEIYIGGDFTSTGDDPHAQAIARWDGDSWNALKEGGIYFSHPVWTLTAFQDDLYIGGRFTNVSGLADGDHLIRWNGHEFSAVGGGITILNNGVQSLEADSLNLYVGGAFGQCGDVPNTFNIARWDGTQWHALGQGFWGDMGVQAIAIDGQDIYIGGDGGPVGETTCGIARWDGNEWHVMGDRLSPCIYGDGAWDINVAGDSIFVGGHFEDAGIDHTSCFAGWNGDEWFFLGEPETDPYLVPFNGGHISAIESIGNDLYIGGLFSNIGGVKEARNIARWGAENQSTCPSGKDTTISICPFKGYPPSLLTPLALPLDGTWEPQLHETNLGGYYNSCEDSASVYIYSIAVPECPVVQDTVRFSLRWSPPCNWAYEACFTDDLYSITIPEYPGFEGDAYNVWFQVAASKSSDFIWKPCGVWTLNPDSTNTITCSPDWNNSDYTSICVDVRMNEPGSGCSWYFPPFDIDYEYWDCNVIACELVSVDQPVIYQQVNVYPVPANDVLHIDMSDPITEVEITGVDGRLYKTFTNPTNQIDVSDLGPGWYVVRINDGHQWHQARMVK